MSPTIARSRPRCPCRLICDSATWAKTAPAGANTNANTIDNVANVLTSPLGVPEGGGKTEPVVGGMPWVSGGGVYPWVLGGPPKGSGPNGSGCPPPVPAVCHLPIPPLPNASLIPDSITIGGVDIRRTGVPTTCKPLHLSSRRGRRAARQRRDPGWMAQFIPTHSSAQSSESDQSPKVILRVGRRLFSAAGGQH